MSFEFDLLKSSNLSKEKFFLAGSDEVGRGCLAGPLVAASTYFIFSDEKIANKLFKELKKLGVTDSKSLTSKKRQNILTHLNIDLTKLENEKKVSLLIGREEILISYSISKISPAKIDELNVLQASLLAMKNSFLTCWDKDLLGTWLIDGNQIPKMENKLVQKMPLIKGDSKSLLIALASIIAKEYRDCLMLKLGAQYPGYGLEGHAGYPTKFHKEAIKELGITSIHRKSFKGVKEFCTP